VDVVGSILMWRHNGTISRLVPSSTVIACSGYGLKGRADGIVESDKRASMSLTKRGGPVAGPRGRVARAGEGDISVR
jgi:hypothetical protein